MQTLALTEHQARRREPRRLRLRLFSVPGRHSAVPRVRAAALKPLVRLVAAPGGGAGLTRRLRVPENLQDSCVAFCVPFNRLAEHSRLRSPG
jgi:hypothetical protein